LLCVALSVQYKKDLEKLEPAALNYLASHGFMVAVEQKVDNSAPLFPCVVLSRELALSSGLAPRGDPRMSVLPMMRSQIEIGA